MKLDAALIISVEVVVKLHKQTCIHQDHDTDRVKRPLGEAQRWIRSRMTTANAAEHLHGAAPWTPRRLKGISATQTSPMKEQSRNGNGNQDVRRRRKTSKTLSEGDAAYRVSKRIQHRRTIAEPRPGSRRNRVIEYARSSAMFMRGFQPGGKAMPEMICLHS